MKNWLAYWRNLLLVSSRQERLGANNYEENLSLTALNEPGVTGVVSKDEKNTRMRKRRFKH